MRLAKTRDQARRIPSRSLADAKALVVIVLFTIGWPPFATSSVLAQETSIVPTTGAGDFGTTVTAHGHTFQVTGGTRPGNGTNLFHSFDQFNVGAGDTAQFQNTTPWLPTSNILGRVTGGNSSSIFGTIQTSGFGDANLFLMNPSGIVFGPNATLDIGGSVTFTTADYLRLQETSGSSNGFFYADPSVASLLSSAPVAAFGFLSNPASIVLQQSILEVQPTKSFSLVGGNITIQSSTLGNKTDPLPSAQGKQVLITSVASPGEVLAGTLDKAPNINGRTFEGFGTVQISEQSTIDTRGENGGTILIRGGRLVVDNSIIGSNTGDIYLDANSILVKNGARLITFTTAPEPAGNISLIASRDITMDSSAVIQSLSQDASGKAGNITFRSSQGDINLANGAFITSQTSNGSGNSGSIAVDAQHGDIRLDSSTIFTSATGGTGTIGSIKIRANNLHLLKGARIDGDNFSNQVAGNIDILVTGLLSLVGSSEIETTTTGTAPAADMVIQAPEISITDGSRLSANTDTYSSGAGGGINIKSSVGPSTLITIDGQDSGIFTDTKGTGPGGTINLSAQSVRIQNSGGLSAETTGTSSKATGGSIIINATDHVTLTNGGSITASSTGLADAGSIFVNAGQQLDLTNGSSITTTTQSGQANGGNIDIRAIDRVRLVDSEISTSVMGTEGSGGNIFIDPNTVVLQGSTVTAQAVGGSGGNITFVTPLFLADSASIISATSEFGPDGKVTARSNLIATIPQLESKATAPQVLLQNRCVALAGGEQSTFILTGRDALPSQPGGWLSSPVAMEHWTGDKIEEHASGLMVRRVEPRVSSPELSQVQGTEVLSLRRLTPSGFLVRSFADRALTGCRS